MALPDDAKARKDHPIATGVIDYFPDALAEIARVSKAGNEQHNPGTPLHWDRTKSTDEADALMRHFVDRGKWFEIKVPDGTIFRVRHSAALAWRALALLQKELECESAAHQAGSNSLLFGLVGPKPLGVASWPGRLRAAVLAGRL